MIQVRVIFDTIDKVKLFNQALSRFSCDFDLISGRYVVDAKSILGIYSLDLSKPLDLAIHTEDKAEQDAVLEAISGFLLPS